ncbi:hypothetical protein ACWDUL_20525 [Nocardia niigatensis]
MGATKYLATALICLTATATVSAATASADPIAPSAQPVAPITGTDHHIDYTVALSDDQHSAVTTLQGGRFGLTDSGDAVAVTTDSGELVSTVPLTSNINGTPAHFSAAIDRGSQRLILTPVAESDAPLRDVDAQQNFLAAVQANWPTIATDATIGAAIGFVAGFPLGLFVVDFITAPLLAVVGGVIGVFVGLQQAGGQPAIDAGLSYADSVIPGASAAIRPLVDTVAGPARPAP